MITTREELKMFLDADKFALGKYGQSPVLSWDKVWHFEILLRKYEFYKNRHKTTESLQRLITGVLLKRLSYCLGFSIPINCFGPGLRINHYGLLVVNSNSHIGKWCDIHQGVNIGDNGEIVSGEATISVPSIGDFCYIGPGAKLFGEINIGNNCRIGANSVINSNIEDNMTVVGIPMKTFLSTKNHNTIASPEFEARFLNIYPQYRGKI